MYRASRDESSGCQFTWRHIFDSGDSGRGLVRMGVWLLQVLVSLAVAEDVCCDRRPKQGSIIWMDKPP